MPEKKIYLPDEAATSRVAAQIAKLSIAPLTIYLQGELGAGKTTFARGFLQALGHEGKVKSPTYTIIEPYVLPKHNIYHLDLYRINHSEELELLGIRDCFAENAIILIEWPERGDEILPPADLSCYIVLQQHGRQITITANSKKGEVILERLTCDNA